ncbi:alanine--tRNA ligase [Actinopolymorpha pittospori]|uniref:Alanine--tRNA ligase n=1 Tax=Actinopolymorpha pittospori TaxID=648752 RepID=A0A927MVN2_9ACTN|nr:alanine--tRNA ligase [Actinopolymorpha pittospori]MBE1607256.1 alanyl-tRNA synthetase [Actinopolymorpha pittospori]
MQTAEITRRFLAHFAASGHTVVPSAPLPAVNDPNLLFVNAGMVQFVPYFLGQVTPPYARATSVQKCLRTPDIDEVGRTSRHGTFFQMTGNFSFGDYFKAQAIPMAWDLLTQPVAAGGFGLDPDRLWVTVYLEDDEAADIWNRTVGVPVERIVRRGMADNFWSMGIPGPCGPSSEIYVDRGPDYGREGGPAVDEDRYLELWNLVFMQYERGPGEGKEGYPILGDLPARNIDTGMGLERVAAYLQGVDNLYEIDEVRPILTRAAELTGKRYGAHSGHAATSSHPDDVRLRVIADHVRTALMLVSDGVTPSNEGRGYVLRRILRRAIRAVRLSGFEDPALPELLPVARDAMAGSYPEVAQRFERIADVTYAEEETFRSTLKQGATILDTALSDTRREGGVQLAAREAFLLHDTYGFPIDLTLEIAAEQGLTVDEPGFRALMAEQRRRTRADAQARKTGHADRAVFRGVLDQHGPTDWLAYTTLETDSSVLALVREGQPTAYAGVGDLITVVLDRTPFYAESGGQEADAGVLTASDVAAEVVDVQRLFGRLVVHQVRVLDGDLHVGQAVHAAVDAEWRLGARQAHSGTHVLHAALRQVLGPTALQSGSYNRPGYLRLDFGWRGALAPETRGEVEDVANLAVRADLHVTAEVMPLVRAKEIGALALFGEAYGEDVRVVEIGGEWSRELCGGTHVEGSAQIGPLAVVGESSVGAGLRRIEAHVGVEAFRYLARERDLVHRLAGLFHARPDEVGDRVEATVAQLRQAEKEVAALRANLLATRAGAATPTDVDGTAYLGLRAPEGTSTAEVRALAQRLRDQLAPERPGVVAVTASSQGRGSLVVAVNAAARAGGVAADDLVRRVLAGKGGGGPDLAQGGGVPGDRVADLLTAVEHQLAS